MSVMSDTERYRPHYPPPIGAGVLPRPYFDHEDFLEQETRHKFDQLARLHELYQSKLALANVSNSVTYQRENSSTVNVRDAPCKFRQAVAVGQSYGAKRKTRIEFYLLPATSNPLGDERCLSRARQDITSHLYMRVL